MGGLPADRGGALEDGTTNLGGVVGGVDLHLAAVHDQLAQPIGHLSLARGRGHLVEGVLQLAAGLADVGLGDGHVAPGNALGAGAGVLLPLAQLELALAAVDADQVSGKQRDPSGARW